MKLVERLFQVMDVKKLTPYAFELNCDLSNGYLGKQRKAKKGNVGSHTVEVIKRKFPDVSLLWLVTGEGPMFIEHAPNEQVNVFNELKEEQQVYATLKTDELDSLRKQVVKLKAQLAEKNKVIAALKAKNKKMAVRKTGGPVKKKGKVL